MLWETVLALGRLAWVQFVPPDPHAAMLSAMAAAAGGGRDPFSFIVIPLEILLRSLRRAQTGS
jgi:hypothetical protein